MKLLTILILLMVGYASLDALEGSPRNISITHQASQLFNQFFPPDFSVLPDITEGLIETFQIAFWATGFALFLAIPLSLGASRKISTKWTSSFFLLLLTVIRTIPSLVWAVIFVAMTGPYPLAGVLALTFYSASYLGKFFTDTLDALDFKGYYWMKSHKVPTPIAFWYTLWPELKKLFLAQTLWMFEYNIRSASIIGYVGAGGLGLKLHTYQEYGRWNQFAAVLIVIFVIVLAMERISSYIKK